MIGGLGPSTDMMAKLDTLCALLDMTQEALTRRLSDEAHFEEDHIASFSAVTRWFSGETKSPQEESLQHVCNNLSSRKLSPRIDGIQVEWFDFPLNRFEECVRNALDMPDDLLTRVLGHSTDRTQSQKKAAERFAGVYQLLRRVFRNEDQIFAAELLSIVPDYDWGIRCRLIDRNGHIHSGIMSYGEPVLESIMARVRQNGSGFKHRTLTIVAPLGGDPNYMSGLLTRSGDSSGDVMAVPCVLKRLVSQDGEDSRELSQDQIHRINTFPADQVFDGTEFQPPMQDLPMLGNIDRNFEGIFKRLNDELSRIQVIPDSGVTVEAWRDSDW